jgi:hypothetical protein
MVDTPRLEPELVRDFVSNAHGDLERVRDLLRQQPALVNAAWDWGQGNRVKKDRDKRLKC